jgi:hypothetical protein
MTDPRTPLQQAVAALEAWDGDGSATLGAIVDQANDMANAIRRLVAHSPAGTGTALPTTARARSRADAIIALIQPVEEPPASVGETVEMPGSNGGFTMVVFKASEVPLGTLLYTAPTSALTGGEKPCQKPPLPTEKSSVPVPRSPSPPPPQPAAAEAREAGLREVLGAINVVTEEALTDWPDNDIIARRFFKRALSDIRTKVHQALHAEEG